MAVFCQGRCLHGLGSGGSLLLRVATSCFQECMFNLRQMKAWDRPSLSEEIGDQIRGERRTDGLSHKLG